MSNDKTELYEKMNLLRECAAMASEYGICIEVDLEKQEAEFGPTAIESFTFRPMEKVVIDKQETEKDIGDWISDKIRCHSKSQNSETQETSTHMETTGFAVEINHKSEKEKEITEEEKASGKETNVYQPGTILMIEYGEYSDYGVVDILVSVIEADMEKLAEEWWESCIKERKRQLENNEKILYRPDHDSFVAWLVTHGIFDSVQYSSMNLGGFSNICIGNFTVDPYDLDKIINAER